MGINLFDSLRLPKKHSQNKWTNRLMNKAPLPSDASQLKPHDDGGSSPLFFVVVVVVLLPHDDCGLSHNHGEIHNTHRICLFFSNTPCVLHTTAKLRELRVLANFSHLAQCRNRFALNAVLKQAMQPKVLEPAAAQILSAQPAGQPGRTICGRGHPLIL